MDSDVSKFSCRLDVVKKTIFRSFKKFYITKFKAYYNFTKRVRRKGFDPSTEVFLAARQFISKTFKIKNSTRYAIILVALIDSKKKFVHEDSVFADVRVKMLDLLKHFNLEKLDRLLAHPEFSFLLSNFLEEDFDYISRNKEDQNTKAIYHRQIQWLKEKSTL